MLENFLKQPPSPKSCWRCAKLGAEEGEVELSLENGRQRKVLIECVEKGAPTSASAGAANGQGNAAAVAETCKKGAAEAAY